VKPQIVEMTKGAKKIENSSSRPSRFRIFVELRWLELGDFDFGQQLTR